jgi:hypothetical protein
MKTYRHKQTGDIAKLKQNNSSFYTYDGMDIHARIVENSSDWELEQEYPVGTKVVDTNPLTEGYTYEKMPNGKWKLFNNDGYNISESTIGEGKRFRLIEEPKKDWKILSYSSPVTIKSIMRLSDGEVFSVGDYIDLRDEPISKIDVNFLSIKLPFIHCGNYGTALSIAKKRKALFTTEDGVDIKEGDEFWFIPQSHNNFTQIGKLIASKGAVAQYAIARFSTENTAKEYIAYNKPRFSFNEIKNIEHEIGNFTSCHTLTDRLKRILKQKYNV